MRAKTIRKRLDRHVRLKHYFGHLGNSDQGTLHELKANEFKHRLDSGENKAHIKRAK